LAIVKSFLLVALCLTTEACRAVQPAPPSKLAWETTLSDAAYFQICVGTVERCRNVGHPLIGQEGTLQRYQVEMTAEEMTAVKRGTTLIVQACNAAGCTSTVAKP
jgi:hypothetical protein